MSIPQDQLPIPQDPFAQPEDPMQQDPMAMLDGGISPEMMQQEQQQPPSLQQQTSEAILQTILSVIGREKELNTDIWSQAIDTLAAAYGKIISAAPAAQGIDPQDQLALEQEKMEHQHTLDVSKMEFEQQLKSREAEFKAEAAQNDERRKDEQHQQSLQIAEQSSIQQEENHIVDNELKLDQSQHSQQLKEQQMSNQHDIAKSKAAQKPKAGTGSSS